ncbi:MAG: hypothetical protein ACOYM3_22400 [Terrimicrobiaceae bacterium]
MSLIAVIGDVHHHIGLAAEGLDRIEKELGRPVAQVFSVGDLGLFLDEADWEFLTGPKKYRKPVELKFPSSDPRYQSSLGSKRSDRWLRP